MFSGRRDFLKRVGGFIVLSAALGGLLRYLMPYGGREEVLMRVAADKVPEGGALVYSERQLALLKNGGRISAVSLTCTHLGCTIALDGDRFACPCHGSVFAMDGRVLHGPAEKKLNFYATSDKGGVITVYKRVMA